MADGLSWPGVPRLLADLERVRRAVEDTSKADAEAAGVLRSGISAASPVRTGYLAGSVSAYGSSVVFADYGAYVDKGTSRMAAHPFIASGVEATVSRVEDIYAEHTEQAFGPVIGSHY